MDKDVNALVQDDDQAGIRWRSGAIERRRALELSGVLDAAQHPTHGRSASLRNTLAICIVALAAVGVMVAAGLMREDSGLGGGTVAFVAPAEEDARSVSVAAEPSHEAANEVVENLALAALSNTASQAPEETNRANCDSIRGTPYLSETERAWFLTACVVEPEPAVFLAVPAASVSGLAPEPGLEPEQAQGLSVAEAIASGAEWITDQPDGVYEVSGEDCNASRVGETWLVTCQATLLGCDFEKCTTWHAVCVTDADRAVLSLRDC